MGKLKHQIIGRLCMLFGVLGFGGAPANAYIAQPPTTLGHMATWSDHAMLARVEKVDHEKKVITYRKVRDLKGTWPSDLILHKIDPKPGDSKRAAPLDAEELRHIFAWAKEGKHAVLFAEKTRAMAHTYVDQCWYSSVYTGDRRGPKAPWNTWYAIASAPNFLKSQCCGTADELAAALTDMYAGKESVVPVVREGTGADLRQGRAKVQGLRVGLRILSLDPKRDFVEPKAVEQKAGDTSSPLAKLAASMKPGTWAMLNKDGDDSGYGAKFTDSGIGGLFGYASKATYDPVHRRVYFFGSGHHNMNTPEYYAAIIKFIVYEVDKNRWTRLKTPQWYLDTGTKGGNSHGYQYQAIAKGQFFRMNLGPPARKSTVQVCNIDKAKVEDIDPKDDWQESVDVPFVHSVGPLEYFPERNSLITINTRAGEVFEWKLAAPKWEKLAKAPGMIYFGIAGSYNPVHKVIVFGGGSQAAPPWANMRKWYVLNAKGEVTPLDDSPVDSYAATSTLFTVDPVSGKHLLIRPNDFDYKKTTGYWFYELDITKKPGSQWTQRKDLEADVPQFNARSRNHVFNTVVVPLPEYGVNMYMGPANVWIYKHAADK